ncbi:MAG: extracellular solute-binding protein [Calditrichaceae bacterium]|nr:extracellular solute-binding protein [Calditrichaceae bacterium]
MMMRKLNILILILFLFTCSDNDYKTSQKNNANIQLTYWCASNPREISLAKELVDEWNAKHQNIRVILQPIPASQSSEEVLLAAIAGGTTPDVCSNMWPGAMDDFILSGGLVRLDMFPDFEQIMDARVPLDLLASFKAPDGNYYQLPWKTNPIMMVYNKGLFEEAGVQPPLPTYSDFLAAAKKIVRDDDNDGIVDQWMVYRNIRSLWWQRLFDYFPLYIGASGGLTLFDKKNIIFNNDASIKVFRFLRELYEKGYSPLTEFQGDQFINGRLATQITGPWMIAYIERFKSPGFEFGVMPLPLPDDYSGKRYTYGDHKNISIFSTTKFPDEAWAFTKTLISAHADLRLLELCTQIPIRNTLTTDSLYQNYFNENPMLLKFAEQAPFTRGVDGVSDLKEILDGISQEYEACVLYGKISPEQAIENAAKKAQIIMEWNHPQ